MKEIWKDIEGYEGLYQISNLGNVRSLDRFVKSIHNSNRLVKGRILKIVKNISGNNIVCLSKDSRTYTFSVTNYLKTKTMTKEEKIKEAWGDNYPPNGTDENGWSNDDVDYGTFDFKLFDFMPYLKSALIRPKSLQGIENNNGWIKIESEDDLPKEDMHCFIMFNDLSYSIDLFYKEGGFLRNHWKHILYYQPIEKPKPPIY